MYEWRGLKWNCRRSNSWYGRSSDVGMPLRARRGRTGRGGCRVVLQDDQVEQALTQLVADRGVRRIAVQVVLLVRILGEVEELLAGAVGVAGVAPVGGTHRARPVARRGGGDVVVALDVGGVAPAGGLLAAAQRQQ